MYSGRVCQMSRTKELWWEEGMRVGMRLPTMTVEHKVVIANLGKKPKTHPWDIHDLGIQVPYEEKDNSAAIAEQCWAIVVGLADRPRIEIPGKSGPILVEVKRA